MRSSNILFTALAAASLLAALPAAAQTNRQACVAVKDIRDTVTKDSGKTLIFTMRNGTTMINHLRTQCDSLNFGGFVWVAPPDGRICENAQTLRALVTGEICRLGKFDAPVKSVSAR